MIVLHTLWDSAEYGKLHLWAESSSLPVNATKPRRQQPKRAKTHPFALPPDQLKEAVKDLSGSLLPEGGTLATLSLLLPSTKNSPLPSPGLIRDEDGEERERINLLPWDTDTLAFDPALGLDFLLSLSNQSPPGISFGISLGFWCEVAKFSLELISRQNFAPTILKERRKGDSYRAVWEAVLDEKDSERTKLLSEAMPPCCRAFVLSSKEHPESPGALVSTFLNQTIDAFIRESFSSSSLLPSRRRPHSRISLPEQWLQALSSPDSRLKASPEKLASFSREIKSWLSRIKPVAKEVPFRTCFRLEPPDGDGKNGKQWNISFHLQATDDRSLLVPAEKVWKTRSRVATFLKRRLENPQEHLLTDLGKASCLFPALEESLKVAHPQELKLTTGNAYTFLRQIAPLLEQSGFGVLLPPWWEKPAARLGVRLKVKPKTDARVASSGLLGMDGIVRYHWEIAIGDGTISPEEFEKLANLKVPLVKIRGQWVELRPEEIERAIAFFKKRQVKGKMGLGEILRMGWGEEASEVGLPVVGLDAEGWIKEIVDRLSGGLKISKLKPLSSFQGKLRPYQTRGLSWLAFLKQFGFGACLADDMGLGKTIQFIALMLHERRDRKKRPGSSLLICPMSVVANWQKEVERFGPSLSVMVHHGPDRLSGRAFEKEAKRHDLVIITYALAYRDEKGLSAIDWECVVLDEAQNIKNSAAKQTQAIKKLNARYRVALTGTPVENRLSELWSIMEFLNPGYLKSARDFRTNFAIPIERYRNPERARVLKKLIQPFVLRRMKTDPTIIKDLPEKIETKVFCHLTREQASLYEAVVKEMVKKIEESAGIERKGLVLATLTKLKQVCNHPAHFLQDGSQLPGRSGKLLRLVEMLEEALSEGDRTLIFTQFASMGVMLRHHLQECLGAEALFLHGGTTRKNRDRMIQRFQDEDHAPPLFILSLKAGGLGLNLTAANHVFHFDRWWNPAVENQATDRAFRIGQKKNVQVHKFVCVGTLEERIDQMIEQKKELAEGIIGSGEGWLTEMSTDQLKEIFALSKEALGEE